jgi:branched-chain amino acid transport system permease protein
LVFWLLFSYSDRKVYLLRVEGWPDMLQTILDLIVLGCINGLLVVGLNLQYGFAGILNVTYISFVAVGAYVTDVTTMGPPPADQRSLVHYVLQWSLPWPAGLILGGIAASVVGVIIGSVALHRLRSDFLAIVMISFGYVIYNVIVNWQGLFNGPDGLVGIHGVADKFTLTQSTLLMIALALGCLLVAYTVSRRIFRSPYGRVLRAVREDDVLAASCGKSIYRSRIWVTLIGCFMAGIGGGLLTLYVGAYGPTAFLPSESFILLAAIVIGGTGNSLGAILGAFLVIEVVDELTRLIPTPNNPSIAAGAHLMALGIGLLLMLRFRPGGILPERISFYRARRKLVGTVADRIETDQGQPGLAPSGRMSVEPRRSDGFQGVGTHGISVTRSEAAVPALTVEGLVVSYGGVRALDDCSLSIATGKVVALIGPNGAGKSTFVEAVTGGRKPEQGVIRLQGEDVTGLGRTEIARRGLIRTFQITRVLAKVPVIENLMLAGRDQRGEVPARALFNHRQWAIEEAHFSDRAHEMLQWLGLEAMWNQPAGSLSGGQRRLLEIGRTLMADPKMLLLDEPTAGLFPRMSDLLVDRIRELPRRGVTVLMVEHDMDVVGRVCDEVFVLRQGNVMAQGPFEDVRTNPQVMEAYLGV